MSVYRVNKNLSRQDQIDALNEMILEIYGMVSSGKFNKNEIDTLYAKLGYSRKYLRDQAVGNTVGTYTGWTHILAETGYSIWKFIPTNYKYNSLNNLYLDNKVLSNEGEATSEDGSGNSVETLLSLSSSELSNEEWKWCSYNSSIYVTIRNDGSSYYEGDYFITSSSSSINKENFFVHNHSFTSDYEDSTYTP